MTGEAIPLCPSGQPHSWVPTAEQHTVGNHICMSCVYQGCRARMCVQITQGMAPQMFGWRHHQAPEPKPEAKRKR